MALNWYTEFPIPPELGISWHVNSIHFRVYFSVVEVAIFFLSTSGCHVATRDCRQPFSSFK